jgi:spermidine synthase
MKLLRELDYYNVSPDDEEIDPSDEYYGIQKDDGIIIYNVSEYEIDENIKRFAERIQRARNVRDAYKKMIILGMKGIQFFEFAKLYEKTVDDEDMLAIKQKQNGQWYLEAEAHYHRGENK